MFEKIPMQGRPRCNLAFLMDSEGNVTVELNDGEHAVNDESLLRLKAMLDRWDEQRRKNAEEYRS